MKPFPSNHMNEVGSPDNVNFQRISKIIGGPVPFFTEFWIAKETDAYYDCYLFDPPITSIPGDPMDIYRVPKSGKRKNNYKIYSTGDQTVVAVYDAPIKFKRVHTKLHYDFQPYVDKINWEAPNLEDFFTWFNMIKRTDQEPKIPKEYLKEQQ